MRWRPEGVAADGAVPRDVPHEPDDDAGRRKNHRINRPLRSECRGMCASVTRCCGAKRRDDCRHLLNPVQLSARPLRRFLSAPIVSLSLRNIHGAFHRAVLDRATSLVADDEISANSVDRHRARALLVDAHRSTDAAYIDTAGAVSADRKVAGDIVRVNAARAVVDVYVAVDSGYNALAT